MNKDIIMWILPVFKLFFIKFIISFVVLFLMNINKLFHFVLFLNLFKEITIGGMIIEIHLILR